MKRPSRPITAILTSVLAAAPAIIGCREESASRDSASAVSAKEPTPEESFSLIFDTFRRGVQTGGDGVSSGFIASGDDGHSRLTVNNQVSHTMIPPAEAGEPYRATITVVSAATYSIARGLGEDDEAEDQESRERSGNESLADPSSESNRIDSSPSDSPSDRSPSQPETVARRNDRVERTFHLVHENGRWKLTKESESQLDQKTERAIISAFDNALGTQA
jgi:hypothetical protein